VELTAGKLFDPDKLGPSVPYELPPGGAVRACGEGRVAENIGVFEFELSDDEIAAVDGVNTGRRGGPEPDAITLETFARDIPYVESTRHSQRESGSRRTKNERLVAVRKRRRRTTRSGRERAGEGSPVSRRSPTEHTGQSRLVGDSFGRLEADRPAAELLPAAGPCVVCEAGALS
jgi:hypothetical protein